MDAFGQFYVRGHGSLCKNGIRTTSELTADHLIPRYTIRPADFFLGAVDPQVDATKKLAPAYRPQHKRGRVHVDGLLRHFQFAVGHCSQSQLHITPFHCRVDAHARLKQRDGIRTIAVALGFLGVIAILRPNITSDQALGALIGLCAGAASAVAMMQVRSLGRIGEPEWRTVLLFSCFVCFTGGIALAIEGWPTLNLAGWLSLIGVGSFGLVGQLALTRAFGLGSALLTAALQYTTIIFAAGIAALIWKDMPDWVAWAGMSLIVASGLLSIWRTYSETRIMQGQTKVSESREATVSVETGRRI